MANSTDNNLSKTLAMVNVSTTTFTSIYAADATTLGEQVTGQLLITPMNKSNPIYIDLMVKDGTNYRMILENYGTTRGGADVIPVTIADGQELFMRLKGAPTQMTVSGATAANPVVLTLNDTSQLISNPDDIVDIASIGGMTELTDGEYRLTVLTSTTASVQNLEGTNVDGSGYTAYTSGGTVDKHECHVTLQGYLENIVAE